MTARPNSMSGLDREHCLVLWHTRRPMTHDQIGVVMGIKRQKVAYIEAKALAKIRAALLKSRALDRKVGV